MKYTDNNFLEKKLSGGAKIKLRARRGTLSQHSGLLQLNLVQFYGIYLLGRKFIDIILESIIFVKNIFNTLACV